MKRLRQALMICGVVILVSGNYALANGFKILGIKSTRATSMGEAFIVQADDPSAIAFNPAGMVQLKGTQFSNGTTVMNGWPRRKSGGQEEGMLDEWQVVPNLFFTTDLGTENVVLGFGVTVPNGLSSNWKKTGFARYVSTFSDLRVVDVNPSVGWKVNDKLSVGLGVSRFTSEVTMDSMVDYGLLDLKPGQFDGKNRMTGRGEAWGYNLGVLYNANEKHSVAATYKSPYKISYSGDLEQTGIPDFAWPGNPSYKTGIKSSMNFPGVVVLGYAYRPVEKLKLEVNLDWTGWETLNSVVMKIENPSPLMPPTIVQEYDYKNTIAYKLGLEYALTENFDLRAGYIYNENAVPEKNWRPSLPDTDMHFVTAGFGYRRGNMSIDGAVQFVFYEDRTIDNNVDNNEGTSSSRVDGEYENVAVGYSLSVTTQF